MSVVGISNQLIAFFIAECFSPKKKQDFFRKFRLKIRLFYCRAGKCIYLPFSAEAGLCDCRSLLHTRELYLYCSPKIQTMEYSRIVAVTGLPGLYEVLSSKGDGAVVRSLDDKSTKFISSRIHNISHLESIEVYTVRENVSLADVFSVMKGTTLPDTKNDKSIKAYFEKTYADMDFERVYASDMKKMVKWFEALEKNNIDYTAKPETVEEEPAEKIDVTEEKPKAKAKASAEKNTADGEKPKKAASKKKTEE